MSVRVSHEGRGWERRRQGDAPRHEAAPAVASVSVNLRSVLTGPDGRGGPRTGRFPGVTAWRGLFFVFFF